MPQQLQYLHRIGAITLTTEWLGENLSVNIAGGDAPHIGCVVLSEPRASLTGEGLSATSSVLNRIGHKDEYVARVVAETLAATLNTVVCCACGIHKNDAAPEDIASSVTLGDELSQFLLNNLENDE